MHLINKFAPVFSESNSENYLYSIQKGVYMPLSIVRTVGKRGEVVLPKPLREALGLLPGREVSISLAEHEVRIRPRAAPDHFRRTMEAWRTSARRRGRTPPASDAAYEERFRHGRDSGLH